jgi:branched-subunit amino acid transport protein|tara:strand:+ start:117 stop:437 length:321 start_codon:yes stop_codon:yes gene_type:complete
MTTSVVLAILVTSLATFSSRFIGVITSEKIKENSKIFRWFNCLAYSTLAALIARVVIFPLGVLSEVDYLVRIIVIISSIIVFYLTKKNLVYPTVFSAIILALINSY